jgi:putative FmdB family regulatory protein
MPTYDYQCKGCKHKWELFQSIKAEPLRKCPSCGKLKAERIIGPGAGIIFRGSGFYQTDYRSESYRKAAEADKKSQEAPSSSSSDSSTTSTKADGKTSPDSKSGDKKKPKDA